MRQKAEIFDKWLEQEIITCQPSYKLPSSISPVSFTSTIPNSLYTSEQDMNGYERKVIWELSSLNNIKWWHRNISRRGFQINGYVHAYPDILVMTHSGRILVIEPKGDFLESESKQKANVGMKWSSLAGKKFRYFMVFESKQPDYLGAYSFDRFMEIVKGL